VRTGRDIGMLALGFIAGVLIVAANAQKMNIEPSKSGVSLDLGYSDCRFTPAPDGQWYQKDQDHSSRYKAGCGTAGFSFDLTPGWTVGIHYVQLGRTRVDALAIAFPGDDRAKFDASTVPTRAECDRTWHDGCTYQWRSSSFTRGVNFSTSFRMFELGSVRFDAKVGAYAYKITQSSVVEPLNCRDDCAWRGVMEQNGKGLSPTWGGVVRWKFLYASWERYETVGDHMPVVANFKGPVEVKTIGVRIPL